MSTVKAEDFLKKIESYQINYDSLNKWMANHFREKVPGSKVSKPLDGTLDIPRETSIHYWWVDSADGRRGIRVQIINAPELKENTLFGSFTISFVMEKSIPFGSREWIDRSMELPEKYNVFYKTFGHVYSQKFSDFFESSNLQLMYDFLNFND